MRLAPRRFLRAEYQMAERQRQQRRREEEKKSGDFFDLKQQPMKESFDLMQFYHKKSGFFCVSLRILFMKVIFINIYSHRKKNTKLT